MRSDQTRCNTMKINDLRYSKLAESQQCGLAESQDGGRGSEFSAASKSSMSNHLWKISAKDHELLQ